MHLQSYWAPCAFTGMHPQTNPQSKSPPQPSPPSRVLCFMLFILQETARLSVCARQVRGSILWNFCHLVAYLCRVVSLRLVRSRSSKRLVAPPRVYVCICMDSAGPAWSSLAQDLYASGRHESGICTSPSPGPWRARRLDSTVWTLVFGWPQLGLISPVRFPSWSRYILGSGVELN